MTDPVIGKNRDAILYNEIYLGKDVQNFGKGPEAKQKALEAAEKNKGSELVFQTKDGEWHFAAIKEQAFLGPTPLKGGASPHIDLDMDTLKKDHNIVEGVISFNDNTRSKTYTAHSDFFDQFKAIDNDQKIALASRKDLSPQVYNQILDYVLKNNTLGPFDTLKIMERLMENPSAPKDAIDKLPEKVRSILDPRIASNPSTSPEILKKLAERGSDTTKFALAGNSSTFITPPGPFSTV